MMTKFAAALLATALIAGPAFAASTAGYTAGKTPAAEQTVKPMKTAKTHHVRKHRHYVARHIKRHNRHGHYVAHVAKPLKSDKAGKSNKS